MKVTGRLCNAGDWFDPAVSDVISEELQEPSRFHRKQWEFALIFLALRQRGFLRGDAVGLSLGGGRERLLYSIARHVRQLVVTDLYAEGSSWDCAATGDPDVFVRDGKPFPVEDERLKVLRMDMRALDFPDRTFDFCYSSCAIEHIGGRDDFLRHLDEVARVLKDGGLYVLTTEVHLGDETIEDPGNWIFSLPYLAGLFAGSRLAAEEEFDARITPHRVNHPVPENLESLLHGAPDDLSSRLLREGPHLLLLRGKHPFTSGLFVLRKMADDSLNAPFHVAAFDASRALMSSAVGDWRRLLEGSRVDLDPFAGLPGRASRFVAPHASAPATASPDDPGSDAVFHTDYVWWGSGLRTFRVLLDVAGTSMPDGCDLELVVHRYRTLASREIDCVLSETMVLEPGRQVRTIDVAVDEDSRYAVLARLKRGACLLAHVGVSSLARGKDAE